MHSHVIFVVATARSSVSSDRCSVLLEYCPLMHYEHYEAALVKLLLRHLVVSADMMKTT